MDFLAGGAVPELDDAVGGSGSNPLAVGADLECSRRRLVPTKGKLAAAAAPPKVIPFGASQVFLLGTFGPQLVQQRQGVAVFLLLHSLIGKLHIRGVERAACQSLLLTGIRFFVLRNATKPVGLFLFLLQLAVD